MKLSWLDMNGLYLCPADILIDEPRFESNTT